MRWKETIVNRSEQLWLAFRRFLKTDRAVLLASISIALFFWFVTKMSKDYEASRWVKIKYELPAGKTFLNQPPSPIKAVIRAEGWTLFFNYLRGGIPEISYPLENTNVQNLSSTSVINKITSSINSNKYEVLNVDSDIITIRLDDALTKKVPVVMDVELKILNGFMQADSIRVTPDSFTLEGPASQVEKIERYPTMPVRIDNISGSFSQKVSPLPPTHPQLKIQPEKVILTNTIEQATEGELVIPIQLKNVQADSVNIVPSHVFLKYRAPLSIFPQIGREDFEVTLDLKMVSPQSENSVLVPEVSQKPPFTHIVGISPQAVQCFFVEKIEADTTVQ